MLRSWRTTAGTEVGLVVESGGTLIPIEVKLSATPRPAMGAAVRQFQRDLRSAAGPRFVVHPGDVTLPVGPGVTALPYGLL